MRNINKSITYQSLYYILLIYLAVTTVVTSTHFFIELNIQKKQIEQELNTLAKATNRSITNALWDMNYRQIEAEANGIMDFPIVKGVKIVNKDYKTIISMSTDEICTTCQDSYTFSTPITKSIFNKKINLGTMTLYSNSSVVIDRIKVNFSLILLSALIKSALLVILFIFAFTKYLSRPLDTIVSQIDEVDVNNLQHTRIKYKNRYKNELTLLKNSVNIMLKKIEEQVDSLQQKELALQGKVKERTKQLEEKNLELEHLAITDSLTSLFNRRKLDETLKNESLRAKRLDTTFGIIMIDIDHFKEVNDEYGHQIGDKTLIEVAKILKKSIREIDILGRWGGEEFLIICPGTKEKGLKKLASNLQAIIQKHNFPIIKKKTASFGLTVYKNSDDIKHIIKRADNALYKAKINGRNRVKIE